MHSYHMAAMNRTEESRLLVFCKVYLIILLLYLAVSTVPMCWVCMVQYSYIYTFNTCDIHERHTHIHIQMLADDT